MKSHAIQVFYTMILKIKPSGRIPSKRSLLAWQLATLFVVSTVSFAGRPAKAQRVCDSSNSPSYAEKASETRRTVRLSRFGVAVAIPENYRTMQLQSGAVRIVHPADFDMLQCIARGGRGGHGMYSETIDLVADDLTMNLREQATWLAGYSENRDGSRTPAANQVIPYEKDRLSGYIVASEFGYSVSFLGAIPRRDLLLKVSAGCDCEVDVEAITELLSNITVTD